MIRKSLIYFFCAQKLTNYLQNKMKDGIFNLDFELKILMVNVELVDNIV